MGILGELGGSRAGTASPDWMPIAAETASKRQRVETQGNGGDFKPKNILVTGGAGFIASPVVIQLVKKFPQYKVVCFDKLDYCSSLSNLNEVNDYPNYKFIKGN